MPNSGIVEYHRSNGRLLTVFQKPLNDCSFFIAVNVLGSFFWIFTRSSAHALNDGTYHQRNEKVMCNVLSHKSKRWRKTNQSRSCIACQLITIKKNSIVNFFLQIFIITYHPASVIASRCRPIWQVIFSWNSCQSNGLSKKSFFFSRFLLGSWLQVRSMTFGIWWYMILKCSDDEETCTSVLIGLMSHFRLINELSPTQWPFIHVFISKIYISYRILQPTPVVFIIHFWFVLISSLNQPEKAFLICSRPASAQINLFKKSINCFIKFTLV